MDERIEQMLNHRVSEVRSIIIDHAVKIEFLINGLLSRIFGLYESNSTSFGNTSSALSLNAKINLLLDLKILVKVDKEKLISFAEIRNQFAHNFMMMKMNDCPEDTLRKLKKWYRPQIDLKEIKDFQPLYDDLYKDVKESMAKLIDKVIAKAGEKGAQLGKIIYNDALFEQVQEYCKIDTDFENKFINLANKASQIFKNTPPSNGFLNSLPLL